MNCMDFIRGNVCKAECCGPVPMTEDFFEKYRGKIQRPIEEEASFGLGLKVYLTKDLYCPFLDKSMMCAIYDNRPDVCRKFGSGNPHPNLYCKYLQGKEFKKKVRSCPQIK